MKDVIVMAVAMANHRGDTPHAQLPTPAEERTAHHVAWLLREL